MYSTHLLFHRHRPRCPNSFLLLVVLTLATFIPSLALPVFLPPGRKPLRRVVFLPPGVSPPPGWIAHTASGTDLSVSPVFVNTTVPSMPQFRHALQAKAIKYDFSIPASVAAPGIHIIRFGLIDHSPDCKPGARRFRIRANNFLSNLTDTAAFGCGQPVFVEGAVRVYRALLVRVRAYAPPASRQPMLSSLQLFESSPLVTADDTDTDPTPSASASVAVVGPSPLPSVAALPSVSPSPSMSPSSSASQSPSASPSPSQPALPTSALFDAGSPQESVPPGASPFLHDESLLDASTTGTSAGIPASAFATSLQGESFSLSFALAPGTYNVELAFVQTSDCDGGSETARIFNVLFDGNIRLESYDILSAAGGCGKARFEKFSRHMVGSLAGDGAPNTLTVTFTAIAGVASVAAVRVVPSEVQCTPVTENPDVLDDHLAHSVPGKYPPSRSLSYVDETGRGYVDVFVDGRGSHTHFAYPGGAGRITSYQWTEVETGKVLSTRATFKHRFKLGSTRLRLLVRDNACTEDEADTTITVSGSIQSGMYCYYYTWMAELPAPGTLDAFPRPKFAAPAPKTKLKFPEFAFDETRFITRCVFFLQFDEDRDDVRVSVQTGRSGHARVYRSGELVLDSYSSFQSRGFSAGAGLVPFELLYQRRNLNRTARLIFKVDGKSPRAVSHDRSAILPIINSIFPQSGLLSGGASVRLNGYGLSQQVKVFFGKSVRRVKLASASTNQVFVTAPPAPASLDPATNRVAVFVETGTGMRSNYVSYEYAEACDHVAFEQKRLDVPKRADRLDKPTSVALWRDGSLYVGQRDGRVVVVQYDSEELRSTRVCGSERLTDDRYVTQYGNHSERSILGVAFHPAENSPRPYVSVSTLFWRGQKAVDEKASTAPAWSNGAVVRMRWVPGAEEDVDAEICLEYDSTIVSNLPVADSDHAVNDLEFTQRGDLLIAVGGATNMGLPSGKLGGKWDSYLAGAVLVAKLSLGSSFNGAIPYSDPDNYALARPLPDYKDVQLFATGTRNLFSLFMARSGRLYGVDMGPNCGFGNASSSCDALDPDELTARPNFWHKTFDGPVVVDKNDPDYWNCTRGPGRPDKVLHIVRGKYYGHANVARGLVSGVAGECAYVDPVRDRAPGRRSAPWNYRAPLSLVRSAKTGVTEYGSAHFCGRLRNDMIFSANTENGVWRLKLNERGAADGAPFNFMRRGGIRVVENVHGDLLFPSYKGTTNVFVARPKVKRSGLAVVNFLPYRASRAGAELAVVGGWGFAAHANVSVWVGAGDPAGERELPVHQDGIKRDGTEIWVSVPPYVSGWDRLQNITVRAVAHPTPDTEDQEQEVIVLTLPNALLYMNDVYA